MYAHFFTNNTIPHLKPLVFFLTKNTGNLCSKFDTNFNVDLSHFYHRYFKEFCSIPPTYLSTKNRVLHCKTLLLPADIFPLSKKAEPNALLSAWFSELVFLWLHFF